MDAPRRAPSDLTRFLAFVLRHRRLVIGLPLLAAVVTAGVVLVVPPRYTARATVLPAEDRGAGLLSGMLAGMEGLASLGLGGLGGEQQSMEALVRSERIADRVAEEFALDERYDTKRREDRLRVWYRRLDAGPTRQGLLGIEFTDRDPEFATRVVGRLVELLDEFNRELRSTSGGRSREFLEGRRDALRDRLREIEAEMVQLQSENQGVALSADTESVVAAGASLLVERMRLEMDRAALLQNLSPDAPAVRELDVRIDALDRELGRLPALNTEMARLRRELEVVERTYAFVTAQLEEARLDELQDTRTLDIIDPPVVPERKSWPRRTRTVVLVAGLAFALGLGLGAVAEAWPGREVGTGA
jgi:uncharacterized protein involved in exopolysaccharide biosynthesis